MFFGGVSSGRFGCLKRYKCPPSKNCQSILIVINHVFIFSLAFPSKCGDGILESGYGLFQEQVKTLDFFFFFNRACINIWGLSHLWEAVLYITASLVSIHLILVKPLSLRGWQWKRSPEISRCSLGNSIIPGWQPQLQTLPPQDNWGPRGVSQVSWSHVNILNSDSASYSMMSKSFF